MDQFAALTATVAVLTFALLVVLVPALGRRGVIDHPGARSSHTRPIVRGGGLACAVALVTSALVAGPFEVAIVMVAISMFAVVGLIDDVRDMGAGTRLAAQVVIAVISVVTATAVMGAIHPVAFWAPLAVLFVVAMVNAFNFMDGINGISALTAMVAGSYYGAVGFDFGSQVLIVIGAGVVGSAMGFLPWNFPRARVFMGDVGSYLYGAALGAMAVLTLALTSNLILAIGPLVVYLTDTARTLVVRGARRERLLAPHRTHIYQQISDRIGQPAMASVAAGLSAVDSLAVLLWAGPAPWAAIAVLAATVLLYCSLPALVRRPTKVLGL